MIVQWYLKCNTSFLELSLSSCIYTASIYIFLYICFLCTWCNIYPPLPSPNILSTSVLVFHQHYPASMTLYHISAYHMKSSPTTFIIPWLQCVCLRGPVSVMLKFLPYKIYNVVLFVILYLICHYNCPNSPLPPEFPTLIVLFLWPCFLYNILSLFCVSVTDVLIILYIHFHCYICTNSFKLHHIYHHFNMFPFSHVSIYLSTFICLHFKILLYPKISYTFLYLL